MIGIVTRGRLASSSSWREVNERLAASASTAVRW